MINDPVQPHPHNRQPDNRPVDLHFGATPRKATPPLPRYALTAEQEIRSRALVVAASLYEASAAANFFESKALARTSPAQAADAITEQAARFAAYIAGAPEPSS